MEKKLKPFLDITIPEAPIAQQRPRISRGHTFNPQAALKEQYGWIFKEHMMKTHTNSTDEPISVRIIFLFKRPKSNKSKYCTKHIDLDNLAKFYLDAMSNDIVYHDDSAIIELMCAKGYADTPSVHIVIYKV